MNGMAVLPACAGCRRGFDAELLKRACGRLWCVTCFPKVMA